MTRSLLSAGTLVLILSSSMAARPAHAQPGSWRAPPAYYRPPSRGWGYGPPPAGEVEAPWPYLHLGLEVGGVLQAPPDAGATLTGLAVALQLRPTRYTLVGLELQSLGSERDSDRARRHDVEGLVVGRVYPWGGPLAPYLELGAGAGNTTFEVNGYERESGHAIARIGLGLELRLGRNVALQGSVADVHRFGDVSERATELRAGLAFRF